MCFDECLFFFGQGALRAESPFTPHKNKQVYFINQIKNVNAQTFFKPLRQSSIVQGHHFLSKKRSETFLEGLGQGQRPILKDIYKKCRRYFSPRGQRPILKEICERPFFRNNIRPWPPPPLSFQTSYPTGRQNGRRQNCPPRISRSHTEAMRLRTITHSGASAPECAA